MDTPPPTLQSEGNIIQDNARLLLEWICPTSPLHCNLIKWLSEGMATRQAAAALGISHTTVWRSRHDGEDWLTTISAHPGIQHHQVNQEDINFFLSVFDTVAPVASGRPYHEQTVTNRKLYEIYVDHCHQEGCTPLSLTFLSTKGKCDDLTWKGH